MKEYKLKYKPVNCFESMNQNIIDKGIKRNIQYIFIQKKYTICIILEVANIVVGLSIFYIPHDADNFNFNDIFEYCTINEDNWREGCLENTVIRSTIKEELSKPTSLFSLLDPDILKYQIMPKVKSGNYTIWQLTDYVNHYASNQRRSPLPVLLLRNRSLASNTRSGGRHKKRHIGTFSCRKKGTCYR